MARLVAVAGALLPVAAQQAGNFNPEEHVPFPIQACKKGEACTEEATSLTLDSERRWVHEAEEGSMVPCGGLGAWNETLCPDPETCAWHCALDGVDSKMYKETYGVIGTPDGVRINYVTGKDNVGSRVYVMDGQKEEYKVFKLKNREIAFDIDVSQLECGMNAAIYLVEMQANGGQGNHGNMAGAKYGTGYCDARCPAELKFINGKANMEGRGACCAEVDLWEANKLVGAMTMHPCSTEGYHPCTDMECGDGDKHEYYQGVCDKDGCEWNSYRMGNQTFLGPEAVVNTLKPITVVTQFLTEDGTDEGKLSEMRRFYVQDGKKIANSYSSVGGIQGDSITDDFCTKEKEAFLPTRDIGNIEGAYNQFGEKGGLQKVGEAMDRGMVMVLAVWDDTAVKMQWLDSFLPHDLPEGTPGALRGPCDMAYGDPAWMRENLPDQYATFANVQYGEIGSTAQDALSPSKASDEATTKFLTVDDEEAAPSSDSMKVSDIMKLFDQGHMGTPKMVNWHAPAVAMLALLGVAGLAVASSRRSSRLQTHSNELLPTEVDAVLAEE